MKIYQSEGVILNTLKFKDYDQILTLFSKEEGLIKLFVKGAYRKKEGRGTLTAPLIQAEFLYIKQKSQLYLCKDLSVINFHRQLRERLQNLNAACEIAKILLASQLPESPSLQLYNLFVSYLEKIPQLENPDLLTASFQLKLMRHDGFFGIGTHCSLCQSQLTNNFVFDGESFCEEHSPKSAIFLDMNETETLLKLALSRCFSTIAALNLTSALKNKIAFIFEGAGKK